MALKPTVKTPAMPAPESVPEAAPANAASRDSPSTPPLTPPDKPPPAAPEAELSATSRIVDLSALALSASTALLRLETNIFWSCGTSSAFAANFSASLVMALPSTSLAPLEMA